MRDIDLERIARHGLSLDDFKPKFQPDRHIAELEAENREIRAQNAAIMEYLGLTVREAGNGVFEVFKAPTESGDYTDPIQWHSGDAVSVGLWYYTTDKSLPHEAIFGGNPTSFYDKIYFDYVEV